MQFPNVQSPEVLFDGSKTFWKTRISLDLVLVLHPRQHCIEIIAHHTELGQVHRLYVSSILVFAKLDQNDLQLRVSEKKEVFIKQRKPVNIPQITKEVIFSCVSNFLQSRLQYSISEDETFTIQIQPQLGDTVIEDPSPHVDFLLGDAPQGLEPFAKSFQKKISSKEISSALSSLKTSAEELKRATRYAELATSSVDGFKLMLAEKMKLEADMKKLFSVARLRWIKAINRVLIQNYCNKVRERLGIYPAEATEEKKEEVVSFGGSPRKRTRALRKSIDNSDFSKLSEDNNGRLPAIAHTSNGESVNSSGINRTASLDQSLPSLSQKRRRTRLNNGNETRNAVGESNSTRITRRSLNQDVLMQKYLPDLNSHNITPAPSSTSLSTMASDSEKLRIHKDQSVPSLLQSYHAMSQKQLQPVATTALNALGSEYTEAFSSSRRLAVAAK